MRGGEAARELVCCRRLSTLNALGGDRAQMSAHDTPKDFQTFLEEKGIVDYLSYS